MLGVWMGVFCHVQQTLADTLNFVIQESMHRRTPNIEREVIGSHIVYENE
jgi:hypothetical protein